MTSAWSFESERETGTNSQPVVNEAIVSEVFAPSRGQVRQTSGPHASGAESLSFLRGNAPIDRLSAYVAADFIHLDLDKSGALSSEELQKGIASAKSQDERQMLSWLKDNLGTLERLGDNERNFSMRDLGMVQQAETLGTGGLDFAFGTTNWANRIGGLALGTALARDAMNLSRTGTLGVFAAAIACTSAISAGWYYWHDRPQIDRAIAGLNALPNLIPDEARLSPLEAQSASATVQNAPEVQPVASDAAPQPPDGQTYAPDGQLTNPSSSGLLESVLN